MAHNLEIRNGVASFVETNKGAGAWHGLGERVDVEGTEGMDIVTALEKSAANYEVALQPIVALPPYIVDMVNRGADISGEELSKFIVNGSMATMRTDYNETLGITSDSYGVIQNKRMFQVLGMLASGKDMDKENIPVVETAGVLGHGEQCFVTMKFPEAFRLNTQKEDNVDMHLVAVNDHTGANSFEIFITPIRVVCNNTLLLARSRNTGRITFRHTRFVNDRIDLLEKETAEMAYKTLGIYGTYKEFIEGELEKLRKITLTDKACEKILAQTLFSDDAYKVYEKNDFNLNTPDISTRSKNILHLAMDELSSGIGQDNRELAGTGLHLINGLTTFFQNGMKWNNPEKKFHSILTGSSHNKLQKAYNLVLASA